jgi:hypothetical protein
MSAWARGRRVVTRLGLTIVAVSSIYLLLLIYPQPLFAYELAQGDIVLHARRPIPTAMRETLALAQRRLERSPLYDPRQPLHVFICEPQWSFALFARMNRRVGGVADGFVGRHVFLRESDMEHDRLIGPAGQPVAADRPLSYFIAHELTHILLTRRLGRAGYASLPRWVDDGYADYVARDIDFDEALRGLKDNTRELDPLRSGLYTRYHLMVAYLLEQRGLPLPALLAMTDDGGGVLQELRARPAYNSQR